LRSENFDPIVRSTKSLSSSVTIVPATSQRTVRPVFGSVEVLDSVLLDSMVVRVSAKTAPGKSLTVERELRWRIKQAFDAADIPIVGGPAVPADTEPAADPTADMAPPSAYSNTGPPQAQAVTPLTPPSVTK
jgi:small conductance mechanosensitive channel